MIEVKVFKPFIGFLGVFEVPIKSLKKNNYIKIQGLGYRVVDIIHDYKNNIVNVYVD
jgi:hypothetical protein